MSRRLIKLSIMVLFLTSCITQSPKYTSLEQVMSLDVGMTKAQVEERLRLAPYDMQACTDSTNSFIYVYRTVERKTFSIHTKERNGRKALGKYVQLFVTYSKKNDKAIKIETCSYCPNDLDHNIKVDFEKMILFITVTLPVILVYVGLKQAK